MSLASGTRLGPYEISAQIGAGGMGEVYRARDTRLKREVAIKILPAAFARDAERLARFRREAEVLAALNHPGIAAIYGLEESGGMTALVLELVEGPTLADRLRDGALALDEALPFARQIAEALEMAHGQGIVHRDLKPANIKITADGRVKVLDFGLAKVFGEAATDLSLSNSPTVMTASVPGTILGTAAYMSPEQARGKDVDKRADVWAFGAVLYEMLTGRQAFGGETATDILGAVVHKEPEWTRLPTPAPAALQRLLRRCLAKDPRQRLHDIADARLEIEAILQAPDEERVEGGIAHAKRDWRRPAIAALVVGALAFAAGALWMRSAGGPDGGFAAGGAAGPKTLTVTELPENAQLALGSHIPTEGFDSPAVTLSPDGTTLAYVGQSGAGTMLYLRSLSDAEVRPVPGTEGAIYAFFSPDSKSLGFLTNDKVKKVDLQEGAPLTLANARIPVLGWWTRSNGIHFTQNETTRLSRVSEDGREVTDVFKVHAGVNFSDVLLEGKVALARVDAGIGGDYADVALLAPDSNLKRILVRSAYGARYVSPGYLLYARAGSLLAIRFNPSTLTVEGEEFSVASGVAMESLFGQVHAGVSDNGLLAYAPGGERAVGKLASVDRKQNVQFLDAPARVYGVLDLSPDGKRLAIHVADVKDYIWIYEIESRQGRQLSAAEHNGWPIWSPDNLTIALTSFTEGMGAARILQRAVDAGAPSREIASLGMGMHAVSSWSPRRDPLASSSWLTSSPGIGFMTLDGKKTGFELTGHGEWGAEFSPDALWVAYASSETGRPEIWVRSYPDGKIAHQISVDGGMEPLWCPCGELFFRNGNRWYSARIRSTQPELRWDTPRLVFETDFIDTPGRSYDVSPDGQRLFVVKRAAADIQTKLHLITNWAAEQGR
jgi:Tol biopolymer transport system component